MEGMCGIGPVWWWQGKDAGKYSSHIGIGKTLTKEGGKPESPP